MHATLVHIQVKPEFIEPFIAATRENHRGSVQEPGNLRFDVLQSEEDVTRFVLVEVFASAEAAAAHKQTAHYLQWRDTVTEWMAEPRQGVPYRALFPEAREQW
jgi:(4S)-4-hydroxy-5-phosphonooxypentane-2,3-dione isomerase